MTIDGEGVRGSGTIGVIDPATGAVFAECPAGGSSEVDAAVEAAEIAFRGSTLDETARRQLLVRSAAAIRAHADELAGLLTREQGKPLARALGEVERSAQWFEETSTIPIPREVLREDARTRVELRHHPLGVVGAITPWNFPILLAAWKIAPALLVGDTMVLKPSPYTPLSTLRLGEILRDVLPRGVLNVVSGPDELGALLSAHPGVRLVSFTGSVAVGKKIASAVASDLKRTSLELGGNDPAIVLADANPQAIASALFWGAFVNCGQTCIAIKRLYVHESIHDALLEAIAAIATSVRVGAGVDPSTQLGPVQNQRQLERVMDLVDDARREGARIVAGGRRLDRPGYFYPPTIVSEIGDGTRLVDEEQFGPALPILRFRDVDEVLERANATHFGLGGSIWTGDLERGADLAAQLQCGTGWVNRHGEVAPWVPFGGVRWSGTGTAHGTWGLQSFTRLQVISVSKG